MRILLVPSAAESALSTGALAAQNIADLAARDGHSAGICAPAAMGFRGASLYPAEMPLSGFHPFRRRRDPGRTHEEYLYAAGALDHDYLKADIEAVSHAIQEFKPELILELGRPAALISARRAGVPCWSFVHAAMYRSRPFPRECLSQLNDVLSEYGLEQVLRVSDLYRTAALRITFSPAAIQPFADLSGITRFGCMSLFPAFRQVKRHITICLSRSRIAPQKLKRMVSDAWRGAPYEVYAYIRGVGTSAEGNLHFHAAPKMQVIEGSEACIHDGCEYVFNQCLCLGIPQMLITDGTYRSSWNANAAVRLGIGVTLNAELVTMASLYEGYRRLLSDDGYRTRADLIARQACALGDLSEFMTLFNAKSLPAGN